MSIEDKVKEVKKIYCILEADVRRFKKESCLKCLRFCSHCCENPDIIAATILEFLPLAYHLYNAHLCEEYLLKLNETETQPGDKRTCILLTFPDKKINTGRCLAYKWRPLVCRLFGFSTVLDKKNRPQLVTCAGIKQKYSENYLKTVQALDKTDSTEKTNKVPIMKNYYMMLYGIDISLGQKCYPLNTALQMAIETVLSAFSYH